MERKEHRELLEKIAELSKEDVLAKTEYVIEPDGYEEKSFVPTVKRLDLVITFRIRLTDEASVVITHMLMDNYGITYDELVEAAESNLKKEQWICSKMANMIFEMFDVEVEENEDTDKMYVLTNQRMLRGATAILHKGLLSEMAETLGGDLIIFPSSIHEIIVVPFAEHVLSGADDMIDNINASCLSKDEVLANHPYVYSKERKELCLV